MVAERWEGEDAETRVLTEWATVMGRLYDRIAHRFGRAEVRARVQRYLSGLLAPVARKNGWQLAEALGEEGPYGVQRLLDRAVWDAEAVRDDLRAYVIDYLGDGSSGVLLIDETSFPKKGRRSCGVAPQYCGSLGHSAHGQVGVFLGYASATGMAFLDRALYLPRCWTNERGRCAKAGIPAHVRFATKGALAQRLLARAFAAWVPARWVVADSLYGRAHHVRRWLEEQKRSYVVGVLPGHVVAHGGRRLRATIVVEAWPPEAWVRQSSGAGCQGERVHDWACVPLSEAAPSGWARWLLVRRSVTMPSECAYFRAFGPTTTAPEELVRVAGLRWASAEGFAQAKGEVGLDQDEVRGWEAWHRQITLCLLAHAALAVTCARARRAEADPTLLPLTVPEVGGTPPRLDAGGGPGPAGFPSALVSLAARSPGSRPAVPYRSSAARACRAPACCVPPIPQHGGHGRPADGGRVGTRPAPAAAPEAHRWSAPPRSSDDSQRHLMGAAYRCPLARDACRVWQAHYRLCAVSPVAPPRSLAAHHRGTGTSGEPTCSRRTSPGVSSATVGAHCLRGCLFGQHTPSRRPRDAN